jgi:hypothetical protein
MKYFKLYEQINKTIEMLDNEYDYFHLSWDRYYINDDNRTFTLTPRVPDSPYGFQSGTKEDDFTKRISLSDSIKNCLYALPEDEDGTWHIYGYKGDIPNIINTKETFKNCPIGYGKDFTFVEWISTLPSLEQDEINNHIKDLDTVNTSDLPTKYRDMFYACVPDANENVEFWSLNPIKMDYLGYIESYDEDSDTYNNVYDIEELKKITPKFRN